MAPALNEVTIPDPEGFAEWWAKELEFWDGMINPKDFDRLRSWSKAGWMAAEKHKNSKQ